MSDTSKTLRQAAVELLRELGPTHYQPPKFFPQILKKTIFFLLKNKF